jgi:hypothetical protein
LTQRPCFAALENADAGTRWHAVADEAIPFGQITRGIGGRLGPPTRSVPADLVQQYFGFLAQVIALGFPASSLTTRRTLGREPVHPGFLEAFDKRSLLRRARSRNCSESERPRSGPG